MKKIIIIVVALLILLGGGFGALMATGNLGLIGMGEPEGEAGEEAKAGDGEGEEKLGDEIFVSMSQMVVPIIKGNRIAYQMYLDLSLTVDSISDKNDVVFMLPRIQDAVMMDMITRPIVDTGGGPEKLDIVGLKKRLLKTIHKVMRDDQVKEVLVTRAMRAG